jgi:hypothetical protein
MISQNSTDRKWCRIRKNAEYKSDREFLVLSKKHKYILIRPTVQVLWSLQVGDAAENQFWSDQAIWTSLDFKPTSKGMQGKLQIQRS